MRDGLELPRHVGGARGILVVDARKGDARHAPQQPRVMEAERAGADDPHPHRWSAHTSTPRCDPSMNLRKFSTSGICGSSARARAIPWLTVMSELKSSRYARFSASFTSGANPARCRPTELSPSRWTGLHTA